MIPIDEQEEDPESFLAFKSSLQSVEYSRLRKYLEFHFESYSEGGNSLKHEPSVVTFSRLSTGMPKVIRRSATLSRIMECRVMRFLRLTLMVYWILKFSALILVHYKYDTVRKSSGGQSLKWILESMGDICISVPGLPLLFYYNLVCILTVHFLNTTLYSSKEFMLKFLGFLTNPLQERRRVKWKLDKLVEGCTRAINDYATLSASSGRAGCKPVARSKVYADQLSLLRLSMEVNLFNLVRPADLSHKWHQYLCKVSLLINRAMLTITMMACVLPVCYLSFEFYLRAEMRLESINSDHQLSDSDLKSYARHDGSRFNLLMLGLLVETKYYLTPQIMITLIESAILLLYVLRWASFYFVTYIMLYIDNLKWIDQIVSQMEDCIELAIRSRYYPENEDKLIRLSIAAHLNYLLYVLEYPNWRKTSSLLMNELIITLAVLQIMIYAVAINVDYGISEALWVTVLFSSLYLNGFLILYVKIIGKVSMIMKLTFKLLTLISLDQTNNRLKFLVYLWHKRLLTDRNLKRSFAIDFFGISLGADAFIKYNAYVIALLLAITSKLYS